MPTDFALTPRKMRFANGQSSESAGDTHGLGWGNPGTDHWSHISASAEASTPLTKHPLTVANRVLKTPWRIFGHDGAPCPSNGCQVMARVPSSTYRLQLHKGFTFDDAAAIVDYLCDLGISHVYTSPYLQAAPGSAHGYDVVDHQRVNMELGGAEGHERFCKRLGEAGLGQVLDIVPNHMSLGKENRYWWDVMENGESSRYASFFDIDWQSHEERDPKTRREWAHDVARWKRVRATIHKEVCAKGFDKRLNSFVQSYGSKALDASCLRIALVGFLPATDPRIRGTGCLRCATMLACSRKSTTRTPGAWSGISRRRFRISR